MEEYPLDRTMKLLTMGVACLMLIGILFFEASSEGGQTHPFNVYFEMETPTTQTDNGNAPEGVTQEHIINVEQTELLMVTVILEWDDDVTDFTSGQANDDFTLTIDAPNGTSDVTYPDGTSVDGDSGYLELGAILLNEMPENDTAVAADLEAVIAQFTSDNGVGDWTITVTCTNADDDGLPFGGQNDNGNDYTLTINVEFYTFTVQKVSEAA